MKRNPKAQASEILEILFCTLEGSTTHCAPKLALDFAVHEFGANSLRHADALYYMGMYEYPKRDVKLLRKALGMYRRAKAMTVRESYYRYCCYELAEVLTADGQEDDEAVALYKEIHEFETRHCVDEKSRLVPA